MTAFITIDIGNSIMKTNKGVEFNSQIMKTDVNKVEFSDAIILNDECYAIGQGDYENNGVKTDKTYIEQFVLYAIACSTKESETDIIFNLPVNQLTLKNSLVERFQGKKFKFKVNSPSYKIHLQEREVTIRKVGVIGESIATYYSLGDKVTEFITILDIGSKQINYATYTEIGINDLNKTDTLEFGLHDFYGDIIDYYRKEKHIPYTISDIDKRVRAKRIEIPGELKEQFVKQIKNGIVGNGFKDYNDYSFKCAGGGSIVLDETLVSSFNDAVVLDDPVFRNAKGSELIGKAIGFSEDTNKSLQAQAE